MIDTHGRKRRITEQNLWIIAVAIYGVGDLYTTWVGINIGLTEQNKLISGMMDTHGVLIIILPKILVFLVAGIIYLNVPDYAKRAVPISLNFVGVPVVYWNVCSILISF